MQQIVKDIATSKHHLALGSNHTDAISVDLDLTFIDIAHCQCYYKL